jgi:hypothetical protein
LGKLRRLSGESLGESERERLGGGGGGVRKENIFFELFTNK